MMAQNKEKRPWFRFHLSTLLFFVLLSSAVVWPNLNPRIVTMEAPSFEVSTGSGQLPATVVREEQLEFELVVYGWPLEMSLFGGDYFRPNPQGRRVPLPYFYLNIVLLGVIVCFISMSIEWLARNPVKLPDDDTKSMNGFIKKVRGFIYFFLFLIAGASFIHLWQQDWIRETESTLAVFKAADESYPELKFEIRKASFEPHADFVERIQFFSKESSRERRKIYVSRDPSVNNSDIESTKVIGMFGLYVVYVKLNSDGNRKLEALSGSWLKKPVAFMLNRDVETVPIVRGVILKFNAPIYETRSRKKALSVAKSLLRPVP